MKKETVNQAKLGLFVIAGVILLAVGIFFIGKTKQMFNSTFKITAIFREVNGLQVGNNVLFAGINVGIVDEIEIITDSSVRVEMVLNTNTQKFIKKDAQAIIGSDGLMGNRIMNVSAGTLAYAVVENGDQIGTKLPIKLDDMLLKMKTTVENMAVISNDLASIMGNIRSGKGTIGKLFMDTIFADNLDRTIVNVKQGTRGFKQNMEAAQHSFLLRGFFKKKKVISK